MSMKQRKVIQVIPAFKNFGAFSLGMLIGTVYGSVIASVASYIILS